jgi:hypothetical protein
VSSHLISRLEYVTGTPADPTKKGIAYRYSKNVSNPRTDLVSPMFDIKPHEISPVLIARRRLSSAEEIESVLQNMASIEANLHDTTRAAESIVDKMIDSNTKLFGSRPNSRPNSRPSSPSSSGHHQAETNKVAAAAEQMLNQQSSQYETDK